MATVTVDLNEILGLWDVKQKTLRRVDSLVGVLLCALLTAHRRVVEALGITWPPSGPAKRILFIKLIEQGATVLAGDAIQRAVARVGRENVYFCVFRENREILDIMDVVPRENILTVKTGKLTTLAFGLLSTIAQIRRLNIDTTLDMEWFSRGSAILAYLTGAQRRVGLHRHTEEGPYRGDLMTHRVAYNPFLHVARSYSHLVDALDADPRDLPLLKIPIPRPPEPAPEFQTTVADQQRLRDLLQSLSAIPVRSPIILLNPNASDLLPLRKWPTERFVELGKKLLAESPDATLVITGAPSERVAAEELCRTLGSPRVLSVAGRTSLRDVLVLYTIADVLVTNDSGPGHFSSMTGIDSVVLFGPATPKQFGPMGPRSHPLSADLACSPCANAYNHRRSPCTNNVCMQLITVDQVFEQVRTCLAGRARMPLRVTGT